MALAVRPADVGDADFLTEMLVEAAFWRAEGPPGDVDDVLSDPELAHYVTGWPRVGDLGVVAEAASSPVGAAWLRFFPASNHGFGFVDVDIPELSMGVVREWRNRGVGAELIDALIAAARDSDLAGLSLSVEVDNFARRLYQGRGFREVGQVGGSLTMLLRL